MAVLLKTPLIYALVALLSNCSVDAKHACADLIMHLDTSSKEFFFSGSDAGTPELVSGAPFPALVSQVGPDLDESAAVSFLIQPMFNFAFPGLNNSIRGNPSLRADADDAFQLHFLFNGTGSLALVGNGNRENYGRSPALINNFERYIGHTMTTRVGSGLSPIRIQAVPEPSTFALLSGFVLPILMRRNQRKI